MKRTYITRNIQIKKYEKTERKPGWGEEKEKRGRGVGKKQQVEKEKSKGKFIFALWFVIFFFPVNVPGYHD